LLADALSGLGLKQWHLVLGDAGLTRSLLWDFPKPLRAKVRQAIAQLNRVELEQLPLETALRDRALKLMDLRGEPGTVLQQVSQWSLDTTQLTAVQRLKSVVDLIEGHPSVTLDLSLIQTFDYYTGLVFEVVSDGLSGQRVLGQGGRYDQLLGLYHPQGQMIPGIGFSLNMEDLQQVLMGQLPQRTSASHWLVVPDSAEGVAAAFRYAQQLRQKKDTAQPMRVEVKLELRSPEQTRTYAQHRQIRQIAWVHGADSVTVESLEP
jgi:ATP phosphoribosyltransferase regulatory subunit